MSQFEIIHEEEIPEGGWQFHAQLMDDAGALQSCRVRLSWADYNHWSAGGSDAPASVAEAVLAFLLTIRTAGELPSSFDASIARRLSARADELIPQMIRDSGAGHM